MLLKKPFQKLTYLLIAATIPTAIIGVVFKDFFEKYCKRQYIGIDFLLPVQYYFLQIV